MPIDVVSKADGLRKSFFRSNRVIVSLFLVLWAIAVLVQFSAISFLAGEEGRTFLGVLVKSLGIMFSTLVLFFSFSSIQRRNRLINTGWIIYLLSVLGIVLVPFIGLEINGARRSLPMPIIGSIQPTEFFKIGIVFVAAMVFGDFNHPISRLADNLMNLLRRIFRGIPQFECSPTASFFILVFTPLFFVFSHALSMTIFLVLLSLILVLYGGKIDRFFIKVVLGMAIIAGVGFLAIKYTPDSAVRGTKLERMITWKNRLEPDRAGLTKEEYNALSKTQQDSLNYVITDATMQEKYAKMAVARGLHNGIQGAGNSKMRHFMPEIYNDFIYSLIIEEYGYLGLIGVPIIYLLLLLYIRQIAQDSKYRFYEIVLYGLTTSIVLQALVNMFVATGMIPVTGQTLPLISYGGSSQWAVSIQFGLIAAVVSIIYKEKMADKREQEEREKSETDAIIETSQAPTTEELEGIDEKTINEDE
ncbi:MAG: FtsW/RodA/SpoVE family cell cycle protein [Porphyromonas endodontalis]|uniref:FtsW/RodA/SpoVE family cell cycle protein n=1 Tax=Porphyromonas endodontalis TaxID=28124 RepID=UPI003FA03086